jgi:hypothetical protein
MLSPLLSLLFPPATLMEQITSSFQSRAESLQQFAHYNKNRSFGYWSGEPPEYAVWYALRTLKVHWGDDYPAGGWLRANWYPDDKLHVVKGATCVLQWPKGYFSTSTVMEAGEYVKNLGFAGAHYVDFKKYESGSLKEFTLSTMMPSEQVQEGMAIHQVVGGHRNGAPWLLIFDHVDLVQRNPDFPEFFVDIVEHKHGKKNMDFATLMIVREHEETVRRLPVWSRV